MSYKILVVEDDNQIQELIVEFLSSQGYKVDMANDGVEGYEKFKKDKYDLEKFKSYVDDEEIELTLKEFNILKLMLASYPKVVSREKLIEKIWGYEYFGDTRVIDAHMKNIRKKIKKDYIKTIKGVGYVLEK